MWNLSHFQVSGLSRSRGDHAEGVRANNKRMRQVVNVRHAARLFILSSLGMINRRHDPLQTILFFPGANPSCTLTVQSPSRDSLHPLSSLFSTINIAPWSCTLAFCISQIAKLIPKMAIRPLAIRPRFRGHRPPATGCKLQLITGSGTVVIFS